jgi:hypothetical protein
MSSDDYRSFLSALVADEVGADEAAAIESLTSPGQRALWQRALPIWQQRPADDANAWLLARIWSEPDLKRLCQDLAMTLMFGLPYENGAPLQLGSEAQRAGRYFRGRFWSMVGGHPLGLSGGYFGHWTYPAER